MRIKYVIQILVIFVFLVLPINIIFGDDGRNYFYDLGISHYDKGDIDNAISAWEKAVVVNPEFVEAYYNLGNAYEEKGLLAEALSAWDKVIE
ncbi:MAG: tetratricopeptide repeat protein, partial [Candidatus Scalindua sp.]|nr:tetratricopeptide repeat protein [Candidatus Scalindua sp.]